MTLKELREKRAEAYAALKKMRDVIVEEDRGFNTEERAKWDALWDDHAGLDGRVKDEERLLEAENEQKRSVTDQAIVNRNTMKPGDEVEERNNPTEEDRALALQAWCRAGAERDLSAEHVDACRRLAFNPLNRNFTADLNSTDGVNKLRSQFNALSPAMRAEGRALSAITGSAGAFTIPSGFVNSLEIALLQFGGILQVADIIRTEQGNDLAWPTADDTSNKGVRLGENTAVSEQDIVIGQTIWNAYKYTSKMIKVPTELLEDSAFNMAQVIGEMLGERLGRIINEENTTGTGASQPKGLVTASTLGVTAAGAAAIVWTELDDLIHSVDPAYRPQCSFMFHDNVMLYLRKLLDTTNRPFWTDMPNGTPPTTIKGFPYTINQDMASAVATTNKTILFGDMRKYKVRQVRTIRLKRLDERYGESDQVAFVAFLRQDGNLLDAGTNPVKYLQQA